MAAVEMSTADSLRLALKTTQQLRASVSRVFENAAGGKKDNQEPSGKEESFVTQLQNGLVVVNKNITYAITLISLINFRLKILKI